MQVEEERIGLEVPVLPVEEEARQGAKEPERQVPVSPPWEEAGLGEGASVVVAHEVVEIEGAPGGRETPEHHGGVDVITRSTMGSHDGIFQPRKTLKIKRLRA
jgi:hypothetical protein